MEEHEYQYGLPPKIKYNYDSLYYKYKSLKGTAWTGYGSQMKKDDFSSINTDPELRLDMFFMHEALFPEGSEGSAFVDLAEKPPKLPKPLATQFIEEDIDFDDYLRRNDADKRAEDYLKGTYGGQK